MLAADSVIAHFLIHTNLSVELTFLFFVDLIVICLLLNYLISHMAVHYVQSHHFHDQSLLRCLSSLCTAASSIRSEVYIERILLRF